MQIQLKQSEIIDALKQYISSRGISLSGKKVDISFTAGRKGAGISADISVDDAAIPGFTDAEPDAEAPNLTVVQIEPPKAEVHTIVKSEGVSEPRPESEPAPAKTTSLFS